MQLDRSWPFLGEAFLLKVRGLFSGLALQLWNDLAGARNTVFLLKTHYFRLVTDLHTRAICLFCIKSFEQGASCICAAVSTL